MVSDIPAGDGKIDNLFLQCSIALQSGTVAIEGYFYLQFERTFLLKTHYFCFPVDTAKCIGDILTNRESVANFLQGFSFFVSSANR